MSDFDYIKRNFDELNEEINLLATHLGTVPPTLVSVTKSGSDEELEALYRAGGRNIGENRPSELQRRGELLRRLGFDPLMHEIGTLQRNKIKLIAPTVHLVHSVDTERLARDLDRHAAACGRKIPVLIEVNSAEEEQKGGVLPRDAEQLCSAVSTFENLSLRGLMTMGPVCEEPEEIRPYFRKTRQLFDSLTAYFDTDSPILSMGMSDSYRIAIEEGSTLIRVGRRLFRK